MGSHFLGLNNILIAILLTTARYIPQKNIKKIYIKIKDNNFLFLVNLSKERFIMRNKLQTSQTGKTTVTTDWFRSFYDLISVEYQSMKLDLGYAGTILIGE